LTSDLNTVTGANLFATPTFTTKNTASNYIEIDGCPVSVDGPTIGVIFLDSILNAGSVKATNSFLYSFYAVSGSQTYAIAR
jgi:hypothetical protein